jgi:hypothetical protein
VNRGGITVLRMLRAKTSGKADSRNHLFGAQGLPQDTRATRADHRQKQIIRRPAR